MKYKMEQLINRSYEAIKGRGLITDKTSPIEFIDKMKEELQEIIDSFNAESDEHIQEVADLMTVCAMYIHDCGYNVIDEFEKVVLKNEKRAINSDITK